MATVSNLLCVRVRVCMHVCMYSRMYVKPGGRDHDWITLCWYRKVGKRQAEER